MASNSINTDEKSPPLELSIIVPSYNEILRLPPTLLFATDYLERHHPRYEIIVVDDGSTDETTEGVRKMAKLRPKIRCISLPTNLGKGGAVRAGLHEAQGQVIGFMDADGATPIEEIERILSALSDPAVSIAIGSRALSSEDTRIKTVWYRKVLGRIFNACVNILSVPNITDTQCGFKFFKKGALSKILPHMSCDGFGFDVEILLLAQKLKLKVVEVPINWNNIPGSKVNLLKDSILMFLDILSFKFRHRNVSA